MGLWAEERLSISLERVAPSGVVQLDATVRAIEARYGAAAFQPLHLTREAQTSSAIGRNPCCDREWRFALCIVGGWKAAAPWRVPSLACPGPTPVPAGITMHEG